MLDLGENEEEKHEENGFSWPGIGKKAGSADPTCHQRVLDRMWVYNMLSQEGFLLTNVSLSSSRPLLMSQLELLSASDKSNGSRTGFKKEMWGTKSEISGLAYLDLPVSLYEVMVVTPDVPNQELFVLILYEI